MVIAPPKFALAALAAVLTYLVLSSAVFAQTDAPTRVENARYSFAFTVEANCFVTYPENGDGFSCIHNPQGGGKGTKPDYGLLVYGSPMYSITADEAKAAKLEPPEEQVLAVDDVKTSARWNDIFKAAMSAHGWSPAGEATIKVEDGPSLKVPYYTWSTQRQTKTAYALMYVLIYGNSFITVQAESQRPFSKAQEAWFTSKLELLGLPEPAAD